MEEFQNRKFHKGREVSHLSNTNYHSLLSKSLQGALQKLFCNFFPQRRLGTTQILNLFWEEEKKTRKGGREVPTSATFLPKKQVFFQSIFGVFVALLGVYVSIRNLDS